MEKDLDDKNIGKKLDGRYEITERIGDGGMADVYRANDIVDNKVVAVKILKKEFAENEEFLRRFRNESKAIALLGHPNLVKIYDVGFSERIQFIVMEYIDGITLNEYMEQVNPMGWKDAVHFVLQILRALQHAHSKGIVHRDIKPQNVMVLRDGTIKVMDFGIAKLAREDGKTGTDRAIGTVHYISPEQARGGDTDAKSDLYSVGVMLYEMLTGKKPFDTDNPVSIAVMHMQTEPERPRSIRPDIAPGLEEIILKAMQKDPANRYQSARDMMDDIETFKDNPDVKFGYFPELDDVDIVSQTDAESEEEDDITVYDESQDDYDDYDEDDDEYEEEEHSSLFVPILTAIIIVVLVVAAILGTTLIWDYLQNNDDPNRGQNLMPTLVGMDYDEATLQYGHLMQIEVESEEFHETMGTGKIFEQDLEPNSPFEVGDVVKVKVSKGARKVTLGDYSNWDYETAKTQITQLGLTIDRRDAFHDTVPAGKIISTDPTGPIEMEPGSYVVVVVSKGPNKNTISMPNFIGMTIEQAQQTADLYKIEIVTAEGNSSAPEGEVIDQSINPNDPVTEGTTVKLTISNGIPAEQEVKVPFTIPANATGMFHITFYEGGVVNYAGPSFNVDYANGTTSVTLKGTGTVDMTAVLINDLTGLSATIGTYTINFDDKSTSVISADIEKAFESVGGIVTTTTTTTTATASTTTTASHSQSQEETPSSDETTTTAVPQAEDGGA